MDKQILVGDIGSTKSTWWYSSGAPMEIHLPGYNPLVHSTDSGKSLFRALRQHCGEIVFSEIWYYGAGIIDQHLAHAVRDEMKKEFPETKIHAASDLTGAALAACSDMPGVVGILGTGSHAAVWNGRQIINQASSLGYILGDEGGGCDIGKALLQAYFYREMPQVVASEMEGRLKEGRGGFLKELQNSTAPNQFIAEFARVAVLFQEHEWVKELVSSRFNLYVKRHLIPLNPGGVVHIVGSIGCIFASLIKQELEKYGLMAGSFIKDPAQRLYTIHLAHGQKKD